MGARAGNRIYYSVERRKTEMTQQFYHNHLLKNLKQLIIRLEKTIKYTKLFERKLKKLKGGNRDGNKNRED